MPYKVYKKGSGYKACKKDGGKCFSKKPLSKEKAEAQKKALYASEVNENMGHEGHYDGPDSVEGNVAHFNVNGVTVKVTVPEGEEDVTFSVEFQDPGALSSLSQEALEDMGNLAIEAVRGDSPFQESMNFEKLYGKIFREPKKNKTV